MSIRKHLLNLHLFLQREFVSNSKEYFEKRFFKAYNLLQQSSSKNIKDGRIHYKEYNDLNDYLIERKKAEN